MKPKDWNAVDDWFMDRLGGDDATLARALKASDDADLPPIAVAANQGKLLQILALSIGARTALEVGTLGGYSTIWIARALPADGRMVTLELDPHHAEVARSNLDRAGLAARVEVRVGPAIESLAALAAEGYGPIDFAFIDADKQNNPAYFDAALAMARPGALIVVDNVVREGAVVDARSADPSVRGVQRLVEHIASESRVTATVLQTVGAKGWDGLLVARVSAASPASR